MSTSNTDIETTVASDPTETKRHRQGWVSTFNGRWRAVRGAVREELTGPNSLVDRARTDRPQGVEAFRSFLRQQIHAEVVEPVAPSQVHIGQHWTAGRLRDAYETGLRLARRHLSAGGYPSDVRPSAASRLDAPHRDALREQYAVTYHDIEDAAQATLTAAARAFREALRGGETERGVVRAVNDRIDAVGQTRTQLIANTRTVETVNQAALTAYEIAGVETVGLNIEGQPAVSERTNVVAYSAVEYDHDAYVERLNAAGEIQFVTAGDDRVCPECLTYAGLTFRIESVKAGDAPNPPVHPNCRCLFVATPMEGDSEAVA